MSPPRTDHPVAPRASDVPPSAGPDGPEVPPRAPREPVLGVSGAQVAGGVLASVSAAVVTSFFGVAGTVVGAGVVSIMITVGSAVYGYGIRRTQAKLRATHLTRPTTGRSAVRPSRPAGALGSRPADRPPGVERSSPSPGPAALTWRTWLARRKWRLAGAAALVFVLSLTTISVVEVVGGRPIAGPTEGGHRTTIGALLSGSTGDPAPAPTPTTTPGDPSTTEPVDGDDVPAEDAPGEETPADDEADTESETGDTRTTTTVPPTTVPAEPAPGTAEQTEPGAR
jgi:hypothetical protein